jgi:hypothetical protein
MKNQKRIKELVTNINSMGLKKPQGKYKDTAILIK